MTTNTDIKPCPFCGGKADLKSTEGRMGEIYIVGCDCCDYVLMTGPNRRDGWFLFSDEVINAWNKRYE